jgi:broad specificity phosphatase PhoE
MIEIILIRHGQTDWNVSQVFRGRIDIELNQLGMRQAELLAEYLRDMKIAAVYSSPLRRALKTAETIAAPHQLGVTVAPGLIDFDYGEWQGQSHEAVRARYGRLYDGWLASPHRVKIPGGENLASVRRRAAAVVNDVVAGQEGAVALVSHRVVGKVLMCYLLGLSNSRFWNVRLDNCGISIFSYERDCFVLTRHNDTSFLGPAAGVSGSDF